MIVLKDDHLTFYDFVEGRKRPLHTFCTYPRSRNNNSVFMYVCCCHRVEDWSGIRSVAGVFDANPATFITPNLNTE